MTEINTPTNSIDALVWAEAFVSFVEQNPSIATDKETMIAWFANAIMAGYDKSNNRWAAVTDAPEKESKEPIQLIFEGKLKLVKHIYKSEAVLRETLKIACDCGTMEAVLGLTISLQSVSNVFTSTNKEISDIWGVICSNTGEVQQNVKN